MSTRTADTETEESVSVVGSMRLFESVEDFRGGIDHEVTQAEQR